MLELGVHLRGVGRGSCSADSPFLGRVTKHEWGGGAPFLSTRGKGKRSTAQHWVDNRPVLFFSTSISQNFSKQIIKSDSVALL